MSQKTKDGIYYNPKVGRIVEHHGYSTRIYWSTSMLDYLRRYFPTTLNEELAGCLGISQSTMIRKARELGLQKDEAWLHRVYEEHRILAHIASRKRGHPGCFQKGIRYSPATEFKPGHQPSPEMKRKQSESLRRWHRMNPGAARTRALKALETRLANRVKKDYNYGKSISDNSGA